MRNLQYGNTTIDYSIKYSSTDNEITIAVDWIDGVTVTAPLDISEEKLNEVLFKKAPWILKKWFEFKEITVPTSPNEFISGEKFYYIGRGYKLKVIPINSMATPTLIFNQGKFIARVPVEMSDVDKRDAVHLKRRFIELSFLI